MIIIECDCGYQWDLDFEETPEFCAGKNWRLGNREDDEDIVWGPWIDANGNPA